MAHPYGPRYQTISLDIQCAAKTWQKRREKKNYTWITLYSLFDGYCIIDVCSIYSLFYSIHQLYSNLRAPNSNLNGSNNKTTTEKQPILYIYLYVCLCMYWYNVILSVFNSQVYAIPVSRCCYCFCCCHSPMSPFNCHMPNLIFC